MPDPRSANPNNPPLGYQPPETAYPVPTVPVEVQQRSFTAQELALIQDIMAVTPRGFLEGCNPGFDQKIRILGIAALALNDINNMPPATGYNFQTLPQGQRALLIFGTQLYLLLFEQMRFSLIDLSYSDGGLSLNFDRVSKIGQAFDKIKAQWDLMLGNFKKAVLFQQGAAALTTPRYQSSMSRFLSMGSGGSAFMWQVP